MRFKLELKYFISNSWVDFILISGLTFYFWISIFWPCNFVNYEGRRGTLLYFEVYRNFEPWKRIMNEQICVFSSLLKNNAQFYLIGNKVWIEPLLEIGFSLRLLRLGIPPVWIVTFLEKWYNGNTEGGKLSVTEIHKWIVLIEYYTTQSNVKHIIKYFIPLVNHWIDDKSGVTVSTKRP